MFTDTKLKNYAEMLNLTVEELENFMKRYKNYLLSKNEISKNVLINGLFILEEIKTDKWIEEANKVKYRSKNIVIIKYMEEIIELYKNGMGTTKIATHLQLNHRARISKSALDRFIAINGITRGF